MIARALRAEVERYALGAEQTNMLYRAAADGELTPQVATEHLWNVRFLVRKTPACLEHARDRASALGRPRLAEYFATKWAEEQGHHLWAEDDVGRLRARYGVEPSGVIVPSLLALTDRLHEAIESEPHRYLAYVLFAEYHVVLLGPRWLQLITERCGVAADVFTVFGKHVELDRHHVTEGFEAIDRLVADPASLLPMRETLHETFRLFDAFCAEVVELGTKRWTTSVA